MRRASDKSDLRDIPQNASPVFLKTQVVKNKERLRNSHAMQCPGWDPVTEKKDVSERIHKFQIFILVNSNYQPFLVLTIVARLCKMLTLGETG